MCGCPFFWPFDCSFRCEPSNAGSFCSVVQSFLALRSHSSLRIGAHHSQCSHSLGFLVTTLMAADAAWRLLSQWASSLSAPLRRGPTGLELLLRLTALTAATSHLGFLHGMAWRLGDDNHILLPTQAHTTSPPRVGKPESMLRPTVLVATASHLGFLRKLARRLGCGRYSQQGLFELGTLPPFKRLGC